MRGGEYFMTPEVTQTDDTLVVENNRRIKLVPVGEWILKENTAAVCINCHRLNKYFGDYCKFCGSYNRK